MTPAQSDAFDEMHRVLQETRRRLAEGYNPPDGVIETLGERIIAALNKAENAR